MNLTRNSIRVQGYPCTLMFSIEEITAGMLVYAHNPDTGETELKEVVQTFVNETNELVHIKVNGEEIISTPTHPFWVPEKGWTDAIQLRAGDRLQLLNGEYVIVEQVQHEILEAPVTVYNFEVEDFHTYYVSDSAILVHNACSSVNRMSNGEANTIKANISNGRDVTFRSKADAVSFINKYYSSFPQESAGNRSAQGWHFDYHYIGGNLVEHINIYSKSQGFRSHIFWD